MQNLSLTEQSFSSLRNHNCIYVDKTDQIHRLLTTFSKAYFMARPRRFGKSLLIDTLDCIFSGRKELFNGLAISKTDYTWPVHPVVRLDFAGMGKETPEMFKASFAKTLVQQGKRYNLQIEQSNSLADMGSELIRGLHEKTGMPVVLLVDEYDKPILDFVEEPELAKQMRGVVKSFFDIVKPLTESIRLTFITGVGRFSLAGLSSGLNHVDDLSIDARAATLVGYTQQELEHYFGNYLAQHAKSYEGGMPALLEEMRLWYNGYRFSDINQRVYNPFSVMKFLQTGKFANYWFVTGTPNFLIKLMIKSDYWRTRFTSVTKLVAEQLVIDDVAELSPNGLLFQAGYLTIKDIVPRIARHQTEAYSLAYPNLEVEQSMHACILSAMTQVPYKESAVILRSLNDALYAVQIDDFMRAMQTIFARVPYQIQPTESKEQYYHAIFTVICQVLDFQTHAEMSTNRGRIDLVITTPTHMFVIEVKLDRPTQEAIEQIKKTEYAQGFAQTGKQIVLIGISFDSEKRNIATWLVERL